MKVAPMPFDVLNESVERSEFQRRALLKCGIVGAALYPLADIFASTRYPGFSYRDQAVSELFAIGAPTASLVVPLFTISSALILLFAVGIWKSASRRWVKPMAVMMALNAINALLLWNFFPMNMRGVERTFTDTMHGLLAINPFLLAAIVLGAIAFPGRFRTYTIASLSITTISALSAIPYVSLFIANQPTPGMGAAERAGQYVNCIWYVVLAVMLATPTRMSPTDRLSRSPVVRVHWKSRGRAYHPESGDRR